MISRANAAGASCEHHVGAGRTTRRCATAQMFQLLPWQSPPCARLVRRESAELLKRLHDSGLSIFEPDPIAEFERVRPRSTKILRREETCVWIGRLGELGSGPIKFLAVSASHGCEPFKKGPVPRRRIGRTRLQQYVIVSAIHGLST